MPSKTKAKLGEVELFNFIFCSLLKFLLNPQFTKIQYPMYPQDNHMGDAKLKQPALHFKAAAQGYSMDDLNWRSRPATTDRDMRDTQMFKSTTAHNSLPRSIYKTYYPRLPFSSTQQHRLSQQQQEQQQQAVATAAAVAAALLASGEESVKFCPGVQCGLYLPLSNFGVNCNTPDGRDRYCYMCNHSRREANRRARHRSLRQNTRELLDSAQANENDNHNYNSNERKEEKQEKANWFDHEESTTALLGLLPGASTANTDKFVQFQRGLELRGDCADARRSEALRRIECALSEARSKTEHAISVDAKTVLSSLLDGERRPVCERTKLPLTDACFLDHHEVSFEVVPASAGVRRRSLRILCTNCKKQKAGN